MTVVVGVLCTDGAVIGTDSSATCGSLVQHTTEQQVHKIDIVHDEVIVAGTGEIGLSQRFVEIVESLYKKKHFSQKTPMEVSRELCTSARENFQATGACRQLNTDTGTCLWFDYAALVAFANHNQPCLFEFGLGTLQPERKTEKALWYASLGSGQQIADPFLGLMRTTFCPTSPPNLGTGRFITCWALEHAIEVNTGGIKDPIALAVLDKDQNGGLRARELPEDELQEHRQSVVGAREYLAAYARRLEEGGSEVPD